MSEGIGSGTAVPEEIMHRKGAVRGSDIPGPVLELLHLGTIETVNLTEWLAIDHTKLMRSVYRDFHFPQPLYPIMERIDGFKEKSTMKMIAAIGGLLLEKLDELDDDLHKQTVFQNISSHRSDSVRCWAAYIVGMNRTLEVGEKLLRIKPFAADSHFGVREIAWMAARESITEHLSESIGILASWVTDPDENVRRFAVESTRPRGVWSKHIDELKENPAVALPLLECVKSDSSKYVQDSVGNWLNDASKSKPDWVSHVCGEWLKTSSSKITARIVTKATRTINKSTR